MPKIPDTRTWLALTITGFAIAGISVLSNTIITSDKTTNERASLVLNSTLPLFGTWVGTVLAYYFARENFEAASRSTERFAQISIQGSGNDLQSIPVRAAMLPISKMYTEVIGTKLSDVLTKMNEKELRRLPILDSDNKPKNLVYYEDIAKFYYFTKLVPPPAITDPPTPSKLDDKLTLQSYLDDSTTSKKQFAVIDPEANLALAKEAMKKIPECQNVFVIDVDDKVIGFLTNLDIEKFSKV